MTNTDAHSLKMARKYNKTMELFIITTESQKTTNHLLEEACKKRGVQYRFLDPAEVCPLDINVSKGDAVYRVTDAFHYGHFELECHLIEKGVISFYDKSKLPFTLNAENIDSVLFSQLAITTPKTINYLPEDRSSLLKSVEYLGGFPIIIKALGGSHGVGVMKIDSKQSLFSVSDFLRGQGGIYVMKEFCNIKSTARIIVLGDKVIDSIEYIAKNDDFRSNEGTHPNVVAKKFTTEIEELAIKATHALGLEFGGVDIMITNDGAKVAEVNYPCFFPRCQMLTGTDIAGMMIDYLLEKSNKLV